jgi:hypothetical protein
LRSIARTAPLSAPNVYASKIISTYQILWHFDYFVSRDKVNRAVADPDASVGAGALVARFLLATAMQTPTQLNRWAVSIQA